MNKKIITRIVAGILLIMYLAGVMFMSVPSNNLVTLVITGAALLLFGDAIRQHRRS